MVAVMCCVSCVNTESTSHVAPARWTAAPGVAGRPLPDEGSSGSRVGGRRLPPQLPPIDEGLVPRGRQIVTPHTGVYDCRRVL